jgi:hypothetical protein
MIKTRSRLTVPLAIVAAAATLPLLTGCFGNPVQGLVKAATGGKVNVGGGSLPSDFPSAVKVASGKIDSAIALGSGKKEVWNVSVEVSGSGSLQDIESQLKGAGFTVQGSGTTSDSSDAGGLVATNKTYSVLVGVAKADGKWIANYTVGQGDDNN